MRQASWLSERGSWKSHLQLQDASLRCWLTEKGSLTKRIQNRCNQFRVAVISQTLTHPYADESAVLELRRGRLAWVREVSLYADGCPVVYARSILPQESMRGAWRALSKLGSRPIGSVLFSDPGILRSQLAFKKLDARHPLKHILVRNETLWARRSVFVRDKMPLLVNEVFMPEILSLV